MLFKASAMNLARQNGEAGGHDIRAATGGSSDRVWDGGFGVHGTGSFRGSGSAGKVEGSGSFPA
ncbi:hypothetical protein PMES_01436 [Profundibacterium mesophilum KAUST100406-0324]|uniref:Uncharacterized protein n=1 Tax=Profundibacterium mesophilum KAUST100406-0324 TaxID=1037889 RepID=A0A921TDF1_9RHOB|nr:hypothetical protein PMES_01436 [Profundibacterium mesophilum KAUST100406-0324]